MAGRTQNIAVHHTLLAVRHLVDLRGNELGYYRLRKFCHKYLSYGVFCSRSTDVGGSSHSSVTGHELDLFLIHS